MLTTLRISEVGTLTSRLGVVYEERGLRYAMKGIGVEPSRWEPNRSSGKGRINYYDGLTPLVVVSAARSWPGRVPKSLNTPLATFRTVASKTLASDDRGLVERLASYLFISSPRYGMDIPVLAATMAQHDAFADLVPEESDLLARVLLEYQTLRGEWERTLPLTAAEDTPPDWPTEAFADRIGALVLDAWSWDSALSAPGTTPGSSTVETGTALAPGEGMRRGVPDLSEFYPRETDDSDRT